MCELRQGRRRQELQRTSAFRDPPSIAREDARLLKALPGVVMIRDVCTSSCNNIGMREIPFVKGVGMFKGISEDLKKLLEADLWIGATVREKPKCQQEIRPTRRVCMEANLRSMDLLRATS